MLTFSRSDVFSFIYPNACTVVRISQNYYYQLRRYCITDAFAASKDLITDYREDWITNQWISNQFHRNSIKIARSLLKRTFWEILKSILLSWYNMLYLDIMCLIGPYLAILDHSVPCLSILGHSGLYLTIPCHIEPYWAIFSHIWAHLAILYHGYDIMQPRYRNKLWQSDKL
jgi:hypothetical protein